MNNTSLPFGSVHPKPCADCGKRLILRPSKYVWTECYFRCEDYDCRGSAPADERGKPTEDPVPKELRVLRKIAHFYFDPLWRVGPFDSQKAAYHWLEEQLGLREEAHIKLFDEDTCRLTIDLCKNFAKGRELV